MGSFERLMPTINPRRYLKLVDHVDELLTGAELMRVANGVAVKWKEEYIKERVSPHLRTLSGNNGDEVNKFYAFLERFFNHLRRIRRDMLVQPLDDGISCTFGVILQTATATAWPEFTNLDGRYTEIARKVLKLWKKTEDEMRSFCIDNIQKRAKTHREIASIVRGLQLAVNNCQEISNRANQPSSVSFSGRTVEMPPTARAINQAFDTLSEEYAVVLEYTNTLEFGVISFLINLHVLFKKYGLNPAHVDNIAKLPAIPVYETMYITLQTMLQTRAEIQSFVKNNRHVYRRWFSGLGFDTFDIPDLD